MEYTREQADQVLADYKKWLLNAPNEDVNRRHEIFLNHKFPKIEVGKWYKYVENGRIIGVVYTTTKISYYFKGFGFWNGFWGEDWDVGEHFLPATKKEVLEALTNEAEKRYKIGNIVQSVVTTNKLEIVSNLSSIEDDEFHYSGIIVFDISKGKWADVVEEFSNKVTKIK
jgi:hypothetical protein